MSDVRRIRLGPLEMLFADGDVRYVRIGGIEVLRRIYVGVRDDAWSTIAGSLSQISCDEQPDQWRVTFVMEHRSGGIDFAWRGMIEAEARSAASGKIEARLRYAMDGQARSSFKTNRTGICVLHPIAECAGRACTITHPNGSRTEHPFPELIAPDRLFTEIAAMSYSPCDGMAVDIRFEGEEFETEDQRNWADGSYKTYCRPLSRPFPYQLMAGQCVRQAVTLTIRGSTQQLSKPLAAIVVGEPVAKLPAIGLQASTHWEHADDNESQLLRELNLSHLRVEFRFNRGQSSYFTAQGEAEFLRLPIEATVHLPEKEVDKAVGDLWARVEIAESMRKQHGGAVFARLIVYRERRPFAPAEDIERIRRIAIAQPLSAPVGGGTIGNFAELNRNRPERGEPLLAYPINPQVHATDDFSIIENLQAQGDTVRSARAVAPKAHLAVGPIFLHHRPDPFAAGKTGAADSDLELDPRQRTQLGAAWTLASMKHLSEAGADSLTYYETYGPFGVMDEGGLFPLYHVFKAVGQMKDAEVLRCTSSDPLSFEALALRKGKTLRVMVACLRNEPVEFVLRHVPGGPLPVRLGAYETAVLDFDQEKRI